MWLAWATGLFTLLGLATASLRQTVQHPGNTPFKNVPLPAQKFFDPTDVYGQRQKRIPNFVEPLDYYIRIQPYFPKENTSIPAGRNMTFDGLVTLICRVKAETTNFVLHTVNLHYNSVSITDDEGTVIPSTFAVNGTMEQITVTPTLPPAINSTYLLQFSYTGTINNYTKAGLFHTSFTDTDGVIHWMVVTHMEPFYARSVFPCLDEPAYKAVFHLTLIYPTGYVALSNTMERASLQVTDAIPGWSEIQFPPTLKMSTYLVAFAIGPFVKQERLTADGTLVRVWGWTGQDAYLEVGADISVSCLYEMGQYTNFKYPMAKSDQLGIPQFIAGAMENFGLIVYQYQFIAYNPKAHTTNDKISAALTMCHELSHQWFGDTVTAAWWDDLFLQEGMAAFFMSLALKRAMPTEIYYLESNAVKRQQTALEIDAVPESSHSLYYYDGPAFDAITYLKGAGVLRMIESTLTEDVFQQAMQDYIHTYKFGNANHNDFFGKQRRVQQVMPT